MISKRMLDALNEQINKELFSGYLYMAMSSHSSDIGMDGFATWFMAQYHEEMFHAMKMFEYVQDQGGKVILKAIDKPEESWDSPMAILKATLEHEKEVTASINALVRIAEEEHDYATHTFLQWYVTEQVEEEKSASDIIAHLELSGGEKGPGIFMLDKDLGNRTVSVPTLFLGPLSAAG